ncbi:helix-turn-helix domain-containing protein, partial [Sulfobacillus harzensis]
HRRRVPIDPVAFGARLRYWRIVRGWTPEDVARLARPAQRGLGAPGRPITAAWIRMMERGAEGLISSVDRERVDILALVFDIPADALATPEVPEQTGHA